MRRKQTWPCLRKQLLSHWICACPNYIVSQPRSLCPSVLWHRQSINVAFSIPVVMFVNSECLLCVLRLLLCCSVLLFPSRTLIYAAAHTVGCRYAVEFIVTFLMDSKLSAGFPSFGIFMAPSANRKWQGWQASECGQLSREPKCHTTTCQKPFLAVIMRFVLSNEPRWSESIKALSLLIWAFCRLYYHGCSSLAHTDTPCAVAVNIQ